MSRPPLNILLITVDDMDARTVAAFAGAEGGPPTDVTPTIDALARSGMTFQRAHVVAAVCQPSRSAIMSGKYPHRNGAEGFEPIRDGVALITDHLRELGYRLGILGKVEHIQPVERFGWDTLLRRADLNVGRDAAVYGAAASAFLEDASADRQPWFLMANAHDPHRPFHGSEQELEEFGAEAVANIPAPSKVYPATSLPPGFLPDLPVVREEYAQYLSSARRADDVVAAVLAAVERAGQMDNTLVVFLSDNGMAFPFAKANVYLQSTRTPLIVRWPGITRPGATDDVSFVTTLDLFPTFCEAAGIEPTNDLDGQSLLPLLRGTHNDRDLVVTVFHETARKRRLEMRCVQGERFGYIWNRWSDGEMEYVAENMEGMTWAAMLDAAESSGEIAKRTAFYRLRTSEELYDLQADPHSLVNLGDDPASAATLGSMRTALLAWMTEYQDSQLDHYRALVTAK